MHLCHADRCLIAYMTVHRENVLSAEATKYLILVRIRKQKNGAHPIFGEFSGFRKRAVQITFKLELPADAAL